MNDFNPDTFEQRNLPFIVNRLSPTIGGEILGVDLSKTLEEETKALIYEALLVYKVIFFRDQKFPNGSYVILLYLTTKIQAEKKIINDILMREWKSLLSQLP